MITRDFKLEEGPAADVAQAVWLHLLEQIDRIEYPFRVGSWIAVTTRNECLRALATERMLRLRLSDPERVPEQVVRSPRARMQASITGFSVRSLTGLAAFFAGGEGLALLGESADHLAGKKGHDPVSLVKLRQAAGFAVAGARYRGQQWADAAWKPADAVLRSRTLSNLLIVVPTIVVAVVVLTHKGTVAAMIAFGSIFGVGTAMAKLVAAGREYRNVKPPKPKPRRAGKDDLDP